MEWKEFLKPTKGKIIAFVIALMLIFIYSLYSAPCPMYSEVWNESYGPGKSSVFWKCGTFPHEPLIIFLWPTALISAFLFKLGTVTANVGYIIFIKWLFRILLFVLGIIGNLFYLYLISTMILKLIEKFKK